MPDATPMASRCAIDRDDLGDAALANQHGQQKAWGLLGKKLETLMNEMNWELVA